jgi:PAS domain S-box-containing protein
MDQGLSEGTPGAEHRIAMRYVSALVTAVVITMAVFAAGALIILRPRLESRVQAQAAAAASFLAGSAAPSVWNVDERTVASLVEVSLAQPELHFVSVSTAGEVLAERRQPQAVHAALSGYADDPDYVVASRDVVFEDRVIGRVTVAMSRRMVADELRRSFVGAALLGAAICAVVAVTSLLVTRQFVYRPMFRLRDAARTSERRFRTLVANLPGAVYRCAPDAERKVQFLSEGAQAITGYQIQQFIAGPGRGFSGIIDPEDAPMVERIIRESVAAHEGYTLMYRIRHAGGETRWVYELGQAEYDLSGQPTWLDGVLFDYTDRRRVEEELEEARAVADDANRAKSDFLSSMSHELRTPLNGVLGYAQILQRDRSLNSSQRETLESIESCGTHLLTLINDVLDLAKIEAGRLEIEPAPADLQGLVKAVGDIVRQRAESKGLTFTVDLAPELPRAIVTDETKLKQVLINLLGNSVKFTSGGLVALRVSERDGDRLVLIVEDSGIGMTPTELERVFDPFCQATGGKTSGGTGLGLSISRRIVEAMSGTLSATSERGVGSTFTIDLPLIEADDADLAPAEDMLGADLRAAVLAAGQHVSVLIADDRPANRDILSRLLRDAGCETVTVENGREALDRLHERHFDLVLMDIRMPVMTGVEAIAQIRANDALRETVVFAVTATVLPEFKNRAREIGFDDFLGKPLLASELFRRMQDHLGVRFEQQCAEPALSDDRPATAEAMDAVGTEKIVGRLAVLLEQHNITGLNALAIELIEEDRGGASLGEEIHRLVSRFDFQALAALLARLRGAHPDGTSTHA